MSGKLLDRYCELKNITKHYIEGSKTKEEAIDNIAKTIIDLENKTAEKNRLGYAINKDKDEFQKYINDNYGRFYFEFYKKYNTKPTERAYMFRFIYLSTYMNYDNILSNKKRLLKENDLENILMLSRSETYKTKKWLIENKFIFINENDTITINSVYAKRGKIRKVKNIEVVRMFDDTIRELYKNSLPKEHKTLGLLIDILPYVNYKYNVLCENPNESEPELIEPLTISKLGEKLGIDKSHCSRLKNKLKNITVNNEPVIGFWEDKLGKSIWVNPKFIYKGDSLNDLKIIENQFEIHKD